MPKKVLPLLFFLVLVILASLFGSQFGAGQWYAELVKPPWNPPAWVFAPVWSALYLMMAVAAWLAWDTGHAQRRTLIGWWLAQLGLNGVWSWLFFAWQNGLLAFVEIVILWFLIVATLVTFRQISKPAALLLVPYLLWVTFATALAWNCWQMNPGLLG